MIASLAPATLPERGLTDSGFIGTTVPYGLLETTERDQQLAIRRFLSSARAKATPPRLLAVPVDIGEEAPSTEQVLDAIRAFSTSSNRTRDRQIAERITTLHRDALAEEECMLPASLRQFKDFFLAHPDLILPKITLTPDGTLRVRWIHGPSDFVAIEFTGQPLVGLVAEIPDGVGLTARHFRTEPLQDILAVARALGALFT